MARYQNEGPVTVSDDGFLYIEGNDIGIKPTFEDRDGGVTAVQVVVKHPTLGEVTFEQEIVAP